MDRMLRKQGRHHSYGKPLSVECKLHTFRRGIFLNRIATTQKKLVVKKKGVLQQLSSNFLNYGPRCHFVS